ncbi:hypothetical protein LCGC14_0432500 [marine sediment metagenome]|uniref:Uncharacterized protein n=1 Tax=marine sediment metagenome TaxID=412755 RepID=A0A0F9V9G3_9ZZZZ
MTGTISKMERLNKELILRYGKNVIEHYAGANSDETHILYTYPSKKRWWLNPSLHQHKRKIVVNKTDFLFENIKHINSFKNNIFFENKPLYSSKLRLAFSINTQ